MAVQRRNVFTANRREIYLAGYWTTYRFQLALEAGRLESILKVVHYRGVEGMRRAGNNMSQAVIPRLPYPKFNRCIASRDSICRSYDQGLVFLGGIANSPSVTGSVGPEQFRAYREPVLMYAACMPPGRAQPDQTRASVC